MTNETAPPEPERAELSAEFEAGDDSGTGGEAADALPPSDAIFQALLTEMGGNPDITTLREIARTAVPLPDRIVEACEEWLSIMARRQGEGPLFPNPTLFRLYQQRATLLEDLALRSLQPRSTADCAARLRFVRARLGDGDGQIQPRQIPRILEGLAEDLERLEGAAAAPAVPAQNLRTATERRAAVIGHLCDPELSRWSDRAIARTCGVSPQTVGNWRRKLSDDSGQTESEYGVRLFTREGRTHVMNTRQIGGHSHESDDISSP